MWPCLNTSSRMEQFALRQDCPNRDVLRKKRNSQLSSSCFLTLSQISPSKRKIMRRMMNPELSSKIEKRARYAIYTRYSSDMQNDLSLEAQENRCREAIAKRGGVVVGVFQ